MRRIIIFLAAAAGLGCFGILPASAASSGPPPNATPQAEAEAIIMPSLAYVQGLVSGTVTVPWSDGTQTAYTVNQAPLFSCSGSVVDPSGIILTAGHCADTQSPEIQTAMIDYVYAQLVNNGQVNPNQFSQSSAEQAWTPSTLQLSYQIYSMATTTRVGTATPMSGSIVSGSSQPIGSGGDVALIKVNPPNPLPALAVALGSPPADGTNLVATGFPGAVTNSGVDIDSLEPTLTPGQVTSTQAFKGYPFIGISATQTPGMSGGPAVSVPDGAIYGVSSWGPGDPNAQQLNFITDTSTIKNELKQFAVSPLDAADRAWRAGIEDYFAGKYREAVPFFTTVLTAMPNDVWAQHYLSLAKQSESSEPAASISKPGSGSDLPLFSGAGAGLLVLAGGITFLLLRRRHRTILEPAPAAAAPVNLTSRAETTKQGACCPACGAACTPGNRFCSSCGGPLRLSS
jgi:hypothetical protein